jgi:hypothetical protein
MAATPTSLEKVTVAMPLTILELNGVRVVLALESHRKSIKPDAIALLCIALRFLNFTDHAIVHRPVSPFT